MRTGLFVCLGLVVLSTPEGAAAQYRQQVRVGLSAVSVSDSLSSDPKKKIKSPGLALALSAGLPGLGQVYNGSYWKVPIIVGLGGWFVYQWDDSNDKYKNYRDLFRDSISPSFPSGNQQLKRLRDFHRDQRDKFAWYIGILYFANVIDAFVDASLHDFDVSDDLSIRFSPSLQGVKVSVQF
ncbi:MAG: DUF5683 domain-containing protein [Bacteroidota bacterium]